MLPICLKDLQKKPTIASDLDELSPSIFISLFLSLFFYLYQAFYNEQLFSKIASYQLLIRNALNGFVVHILLIGCFCPLLK